MYVLRKKLTIKKKKVEDRSGPKSPLTTEREKERERGAGKESHRGEFGRFVFGVRGSQPPVFPFLMSFKKEVTTVRFFKTC